MNKTMILRLGCLALGLTLSACAEYRPATANCFNFQADTPNTPRVSTKGAAVTRADTSCTFTAIGLAD
ncbi:hypothetical protein CDZ97_20450 [Mameliella alba]|nr:MULTISPECIES: hypothetical protein [Mameliella]OWV40339.1 hypothetical protein CDZ95_22255 [Mameliella alba]OWV58891.1 hypothetical protein CDZ97_20450 [Mameliella alba]